MEKAAFSESGGSGSPSRATRTLPVAAFAAGTGPVFNSSFVRCYSAPDIDAATPLNPPYKIGGKGA
jgi:hypothetical protein